MKLIGLTSISKSCIYFNQKDSLKSSSCKNGYLEYNMNIMSKETPHIPNISTTPEQVLAEKETKEKTAPLGPEQIKEQVNKLFELSAARAEARRG